MHHKQAHRATTGQNTSHNIWPHLALPGMLYTTHQSTGSQRTPRMKEHKQGTFDILSYPPKFPRRFHRSSGSLQRLSVKPRHATHCLLHIQHNLLATLRSFPTKTKPTYDVTTYQRSTPLPRSVADVRPTNNPTPPLPGKPRHTSGRILLDPVCSKPQTKAHAKQERLK